MISMILGHQITENPLLVPHQIEPNKENHDRVAAGHHSVQTGSVVHQAHLRLRTGGGAPPRPLRGRGEAGVGQLVLRLIIREVVERTDHLLLEIDQVKTATYRRIAIIRHCVLYVRGEILFMEKISAIRPISLYSHI